jgi:putative lipoic acid-binding regulatory protein
VARAAPDLRARLDAVFVRHFGAFEANRVTERASGQSHFLALTYAMVVQGEDQLKALNAELQSTEGVVLVL